MRTDLVRCNETIAAADRDKFRSSFRTHPTCRERSALLGTGSPVNPRPSMPFASAAPHPRWSV